MDIFFSIAFLLISGYWCRRLVRALVRRASFMRRLREICGRRGYELHYTRNRIASFFAAGARPDVVVRTRDTDFCLRFVTSINRAKFYYFASEEYAVSYQKGAIAMPFAKSADTVTMQRKFHYFPPKSLPDFSEGRPNVRWIFLFNPAPAEIESINAAATKHYIVGNGDPIGAATAYDAPTFCELIDKNRSTDGLFE